MFVRNSLSLIKGFSRSFSVSIPKVTPPSAQSLKVNSSVLSNGVRVVSLEGSLPNVGVGLTAFVNTGSRFETNENSGISQLLKNFAFRYNKNASALMTVRNLEYGTENTVSRASRENVSVSFDVLPDKVNKGTHLLSSILQPSIWEWEVREAASEESQRVNTSWFQDLLHNTAYRGVGLGRSLQPSSEYEVSFEAFKNHVASTYTSSNVTVVGVNISHSELQQTAQEAFKDFPSTKPKNKSVESPYVGGESIFPAGSEETHVVLAHEGFSATHQDQAVLRVLKEALGYGSNKPNEGRIGHLTSYLSRHVSNIHGWVSSVGAFNFPYSDSGLFGIYGVAEAGHANELALCFTEAFQKLGKLDEADLARAKSKARLAVLGADSRAELVDFIGSQLSGTVKSPVELADAINAVTLADVQRVTKKLLSSKPTLVAVGDVSGLQPATSLYSS